MKPTGLNWVNWLSWDLLPFTLGCNPICVPYYPLSSLIDNWLWMCSDFLHYRVLPDHALSRLLVQVGNLRIRKRECESVMGWDWNPGLLRQTGAHDLAVSTEGWGWGSGKGVGALMGWKNMEWGSSEAQEQVQGWVQITGSMDNIKWIHEACLHGPIYYYYVTSLFTKETLTRSHWGKRRNCVPWALC